MNPNNLNKNNLNQKNSKWIWWFSITIILLIVIISLYLITDNSSKKKSGKGQNLNLLVITLDTTRTDRIGAYGYKPAQTKNIDSLASRGVLFENCYSSVPLTLPAHCSIFTGKYPLGHQARDNGTYFLDEDHLTLAEEMKKLGYHTSAIIASFVLQSKFGLNQGFDFYDDSLNIKEMVTDYDSEIKAEQVYANFNRWFDNARNKSKKNKQPFKFFAWVHFYDPHLPYKPPSPYKEKFDEYLEGQYSGELAYMDFYIGKIIDSLKTANRLENTLIIIVGDHGEAFGEHQEFGHSIFCYEESLRVPLIIYNEKLFPKRRTIEDRVNIIDIMPTVLELYGQEVPDDIQGRSFTNLLKGKKEKNPRTFYIESMHGKEEMGWAPLTGIIYNQYKYISLPEPELYDLNADPKEKDNLFWKKNRLAKSLDNRLLKMVKTYSAAQSKSISKRKLTAEDKKHLQSLGYISAFADSGNGKVAIDPKKGIALEAKLNQIEIAIKQGKLGEAEVSLDKIAKQYPDMPLPLYFILRKSIYEEQNNMEGIVKTWQEAIKTFPNNSNFKINLGFQYFQLNRLEEAELLGKQILEENDHYTKAYILLGRIKEKQDKNQEALSYFEKAYNLEPRNVSLQISYAKVLGINGNFKKAVNLCKELLANEDVAKENDLKKRIGIVLTEIHQDDLAFNVLSEVKDAEKADAETWNYLGIIHYRRHEFDKASAAYIKSIDLDPNIAETYNNLGTLYLSAFTQKKDPQLRDMGMKAFNKALKLEPTLISALNGRAAAYKFNREPQKALRDWKKILSLQSGFIDAYFNIGITYLELNKKKEALEYLNKAKKKFNSQLPQKEQKRLERLINSAGG